MKVHVNLLHPDEQRYQGLVSLRFIFLASIVTLTAVVILVGSFALYSFFSKRQDLVWARDQWLKAEPLYKQTLALQQEQKRIKVVVDELNGWNHARLPLHQLLAELQRIVAPHPIQFSRLTITGERSLVQPPAVTNVPKAEAKSEPAAGAKPAVPPKPPPAIPAWRFRITIAGRVFGEAGHTAVVAFNEQLQRDPHLVNIFESVHMQGLSKASRETQRGNEQVFTIEALTPLRKFE
ncbi:MAG: hypothetical protein EPN23_03075 [Verrucomicrobia bacterium]|nr:MAG: hypothetical protein EPN23_03075 [Verrucomicrobiota bacterium]